MGSRVDGSSASDPAAARGHAGSAHDDLIARAAHELRGPLGSIANWVHLLSEASKDGALQQQGLAAIQRALQVSSRLIDELSDVALLRSGRLRLRTGLLDLVPVVELALERTRSLARDKGVTLEVVRGAPSIPVVGDPDRLQQMVLQLLDNAVKFTPAGGRVELSVGRDGTSWYFAVGDTGAGIAPDVLPRLFGGLRPGDFVAPRAPASLGVGLTIVHHVAELHGGSVVASSPGLGRGARFVVRLPVPALVPFAHSEPAAAAPDKDQPAVAAGPRSIAKLAPTKRSPRLLPGG